MRADLTSYAVLGVAALVVGAGAWLYFKGPKEAAKAAVGAAGDAVAGAVEALGEQIGIPNTDEAKCLAAMANGRSIDVSLYCPLGTFLRWVISGRPKSLSNKLATPIARPDLGYSRYQPISEYNVSL